MPFRPRPTFLEQRAPLPGKPFTENLERVVGSALHDSIEEKKYVMTPSCGVPTFSSFH
jgi:hypothetical protein